MRTPSATDVMQVLDSVYAVGQSHERWIRGVLAAVSSVWTPGAGVGGIVYDISDGRHLRTSFIDGLGIPDGWREMGIANHRDPRMVPSIIDCYRSRLCATLSEAWAADPRGAQTYRDAAIDDYGVADQIIVNGADCAGQGCALYLFSPTRLTLAPAERQLLQRLATHLSTAHRLQRRLAAFQAGDESSGIEAVLTPAGKVDHAEAGAQSTDARRGLQLAVRQRERNRDLATRDAERAVRSLKGLVDARWTLVDHYESGGKRYVLARENAPRTLGPVRLSERERQVLALAALGRSNKLIAYELGLAHSTVRVLMSRASVKLGGAKRSELIARHRAVGS